MSSSQTSEEDTSSLTRDSIIEYSDIGDSSILDPSVTVNNKGNLRNAPSSKRDNPIRFYRQKRFWGMCLAVNVVLSAISIPLLYLVIIPAAARSAVNKADLNFQAINITDITDDSFIMNMKGETTGAGPFSAKIEFNGPVSVSFNGNKLGETELGDISVSKGAGALVGAGQKFIIKDKPQFTNFAATTLTAESFKWTIDGSVNVKTFGTKIKNIILHKEVTILGSNNFNTSLVDLKINQNPDKSLSLEMTTILYNPSPIGIEIGDMYLQINYNGTTIANAVAKGVFLNTKENILNMSAISELPTTDADRFNYIKVINGYLTNTPVNTVAKVLDIISPNGRIDWLISATKNLNLTTAVGQTKAPQLISQIDFGEMNMKFTPDAPFSPTFSAKGASAKLTLPFNIDFNILAVSQNLTLFAQGKPIGTINIPESNVTSNGTEITLDIPETQINVDKDSEDPFKEFLVSITTTTGTDVIVAGTSDARVTTVIGDNIPIQGLPLNISTTLQGFNQFNSGGGPPAVGNITILAGNPNELIIGAVVTLTNPSHYSSSAGSVAFNLFFREQLIGTVAIQDLTVVPGPNPLAVVITLNDPENNAGKEIITSFLTGQPISLDIRGFDGSTNIASLAPAFKAIDIQTSLPTLPQQLVTSSKLVVDNQTATTNGIVEIANAFVAPISIYTMNSSFSFNGNAIGTYEQDMSNNPIFIPGNTVKSLELPVSMNTDPVVSFSMLRTLALQNNLDVSVLDSLIVLSKVNVPGVDPNVQPTPEAIRSFDLAKFITTALAKIPVTIDLDSRIAVGYYFMSIKYQQNITVETDSTIVSMISTFATPLINQLLGQAQMTIDSVFSYDIDVASFDIYITGLISNTGPLPAVINFPNGIQMSSGDVILGNVVNIPPIIVDPIDGAKLNGSSRFEIADIPTFTSFTGALLTTDTIEGTGTGVVVVTSFGAQIGPIPIKQSIDMAGLSSLQEKLTGFIWPKAGDPNFSANVALYNPSGFGIELGKVVYNLSIEGEQISTVTGDNVVISPKGISDITLQGPVDLTNPTIISNILAKAPLTVQGVSVTPPKATGEVVWLSESFKNMKITMPIDLSGLGIPATPPAP